MFIAYVQEWKENSAAVLPSLSSEEAYRNADRPRLELMPSSTGLNETTMDSLNNKVKEHSSGTAATGKERTKLVLESVNAMGKGMTTAVAGTAAVGAGVEPFIVDSNWRAFINSEAVKELENIISAELDADPVVYMPLIIKVTHDARCQ